jgi:tRNA(Ile)-lysidine synthase
VQHKSSSLIEDEFERALGEIRARVSVSSTALAVAYSGGLDSAALLHLTHRYAQTHGLSVFAFHVHHGLSPNAGTWLAHCRGICEQRGIAFDARHVDIALDGKSGVEEAARLRRYAALGEMCRAHDVPLLLTAHHQDDQAETVLLQLLRGSGVAGLSGMDCCNHAPDLFGDAQLLMGRPLLQTARTELEAYASTHEIAHIEDESNLDPRYARNALRHQVMPVLQQLFPGYQQRFARTAEHAQSAQRLLIELAARDLSECLDGDRLDVKKLRAFDADRIDNMLRYWFGSRGMRMPSTAWLDELRTQLLEAKYDAQLCVTHADCHVRRHRDYVFITPKRDAATQVPAPQDFTWQGEPSLHWPQFGGTLYFDAGEQGIDADWLCGTPLTIRLRGGGERLKPAENRPTRSLKQHYQSRNVPAWERERLPLVFAEKQLLFAAGIGMDCSCLTSGAKARIMLRWEFDDS